jgi:hypothetical protein
VWSIVLPATSYAYIDPGTGSYVFQLLIAGILSALVSIKIFWRNIKKFFARSRNGFEQGQDGDE